ncbi:type I methionyl aminopeptidase [Brevundimonas sp. Root1279]|uniref:type I methionyl aminopeptidase n=1 Tax=Brevundimonas sp. Root1279 TaxID=1736443 RepID=UPI0006F8EA39|nr:type I methionyl aminopeptidase [Brevundimonas sp. Root1279]KQW84158.1 methionine aminopeptidase [Brevundimonas sp. Root1279]
MARSGRLLAQVFEHIDTWSLAGMTTMEINDRVERFIVDDLGARPASKGQYNYPYVLNVSINDVVCHGMPRTDETLKNGDIVNLDITLETGGYIADSSKTYMVGAVKAAAVRLVRATYQALWKGIGAVRPGARIGDIGHAIESHARQNGFTVVRDYCGHGIGREMHEDPQVLHFGKAGTGMVLREGMTFTIEPMINAGRREVAPEEADGWTVRTADGSLSAQFEHTVAVTATGVRVLTLRSDEAGKVGGRISA